MGYESYKSMNKSRLFQSGISSERSTSVYNLRASDKQVLDTKSDVPNVPEGEQRREENRKMATIIILGNMNRYLVVILYLSGDLENRDSCKLNSRFLCARFTARCSVK